MRKTLTIRLLSTRRTDLPCIVCGRFRTDAAVMVGGQLDQDMAEAGIHKACMPGPKKRAAKEAA
jgi:hypothetical protein